MSTCSLFFVLCTYIHVGNWFCLMKAFWENMYIYILAFRFYEFFFFRGMKSKLFTNPASLSKSVKNIRIFRSKGESTCVYFFFSSYFSMGKSQRQRYFSASHISVWYIGMEQGLFLWRLWFPFPISPAFVCRRYQGKEQAWVEERTKKKKKKKRRENSKRQAEKNEDRKRQPVGWKAGTGRDFSKLIPWLYNERIWGPEPISNKHTQTQVLGQWPRWNRISFS